MPSYNELRVEGEALVGLSQACCRKTPKIQGGGDVGQP